MLASRGHVQPHFNNVPRRQPRMQCLQSNLQPSAYATHAAPNSPQFRTHVRKQRIKSRPPGFQELFFGSRVWISHNFRSYGDDGDHESAYGSVEEARMDRDWMWDEQLGFSGVIRVGVCDHSRGFSRRYVISGGGTRREELELVIGREQTLHCDDIGISALSDSQLDDAADFLDQCRRQADNTGKVLIISPPGRPAEALSIALFALSLPSTTSFLSSSSTSSYLSQLSFPPGILELMQEDRGFTLIQVALWHIHDSPLDRKIGEHSGLKSEWRGALSFDGIQRLESLSVLKEMNCLSGSHTDLI